MTRFHRMNLTQEEINAIFFSEPYEPATPKDFLVAVGLTIGIVAPVFFGTFQVLVWMGKLSW